MQFQFNEEIKKQSFFKKQFFAIEAIGGILIIVFSIVSFFGLLALVGEFPTLVNLIKENFLLTIIYFTLTLPLVILPSFVLIYQTYSYFRMYHYFKKDKSGSTQDSIFAQVYYFTSTDNLAFPESAPYPHDVGELQTEPILKFKGIESSFEIDKESIQSVKAKYFGRFKFIFKVKMTSISIKKNAEGISLVVISNISSPIFWIIKNKNDELLRKVQTIYQRKSLPS